MPGTTLKMMNLESEVMGQRVPLAVVLPPGFDPTGDPLPLFIELHGGIADRTWIEDFLHVFDAMFTDGTLCPAVLVTFSSGHMSWFGGSWPKFIVEELPAWMAENFHTRADGDGVVLTGISMGGYGTLKVGLRHPDRFAGIAAMEPGVEPALERMPDDKRNTWYRLMAAHEAVWGRPIDEKKWRADDPANIVLDNAGAIRESGLPIYLECGDQDTFNLHDGAEFLHRVLWDHDIRHEYHLVRWANHVGSSLLRRFPEAHAFLAAALSGGRVEPIDLPLTVEEMEFTDWVRDGRLKGAPPPDFKFSLTKNPERLPSAHEALWGPLRSAAAADPEMKRAFAKLPPTS